MQTHAHAHARAQSTPLHPQAAWNEALKDYYAAYNKPVAVKDWLAAHPQPKREWLLLLDADMLLR